MATPACLIDAVEEGEHPEHPALPTDAFVVQLVGPALAPTWKNQWNRMIRWKADLDWTYRGRSDLLGSEEALDHALAFFLVCYHVSDWLDRDGFTGAKDYARSDPALRVCRDLANGHKHLVLDARASFPNVTVSDRSATLAAGTLSHVFTIAWTDDTGELQKKDCLQLADECIAAWRSFMAANGYPSVEY